MEVKTVVRAWGNSLAVILPKNITDAKKIKENEEITIEIKKRPIAAEFFGRFVRHSKRNAQKIKDEMRSGWE